MLDPSLLVGGGGSHVTSIIQLPPMGDETSSALTLCGAPGAAENDYVY